MTLAIPARDSETGKHALTFGVCLAIAAPGRCHKVGAAMLQQRTGAEAVIAAMVGGNPGIAYRPLNVLDRAGAIVGCAFTSQRILGAEKRELNCSSDTPSSERDWRLFEKTRGYTTVLSAMSSPLRRNRCDSH